MAVHSVLQLVDERAMYWVVWTDTRMAVKMVLNWVGCWAAKKAGSWGRHWVACSVECSVLLMVVR